MSVHSSHLKLHTVKKRSTYESIFLDLKLMFVLSLDARVSLHFTICGGRLLGILPIAPQVKTRVVSWYARTSLHFSI
jgi:hypothetical protein